MLQYQGPYFDYVSTFLTIFDQLSNLLACLLNTKQALSTKLAFWPILLTNLALHANVIKVWHLSNVKKEWKIDKSFEAFSEYLNFNKSQVLTLLLYISGNFAFTSLKSHWQNRHYIFLCNHITILFSKLCTCSKKLKRYYKNYFQAFFHMAEE